jgi:hypothetical protein
MTLSGAATVIEGISVTVLFDRCGTGVFMGSASLLDAMRRQHNPG